MGERKGTNKYYPPDYDPRRGGLNKFLGTHALRERARKLHLGILIIRFEMPFNVWCEGCGNHVGMGVRYNAEKKQVGMYYSTPVFEFRMKCHLCDNYFVMRTDPEHFDYECVEGLRRQERRWEMEENEQIASMEKEKSRKIAADAMYKLEHVETDEAKAKAAGPEMQKLEALQYRMKDDFARNQELRQLFRTRKKELKKEEETDKNLLAKSSLDIPLVPENEDDRRLASLIAKYRTVQSVDEKRAKTLERLDKKSIFASSLKGIRKRPALSSTASTSSSSATTESSVKAKKIAILKDDLRESRLSSKLLKLDRDLGQQQATASSIVLTKKELETMGSESSKSDGANSVSSPAVQKEKNSRRENNLALLRQSYGGDDSSSGSSSDGGS